MKPSLKKTFYWSLGSHAGLLILVLIVSFITSCAQKTKIPPHVFTLNSPPTQQVTQKQISKPVQKPARKPIQKPKPQPAKIQPTRKKQPPPPSQQSYRDFLKENPVAEPTPTTPRVQKPTKQTDPFEQIRKELNLLLKNASNDTRNSNANEIKALYSYIGQLRNQLNILWEQPRNLPTGEWIAQIEFTVSSTGKISGVRFVRKSENAVFDQSLIRAMNQFLTVSAPPDRKKHTFEIPFRMLVR